VDYGSFGGMIFLIFVTGSLREGPYFAVPTSLQQVSGIRLVSQDSQGPDEVRCTHGSPT